jgi:hypothetical protein
MLRILATDALQFFRPMKHTSGAIRISWGHEMKVRRKQASWLAHVFRGKASVARIRNILLSFEYIRKENRHLNLNLIFIIVKYVSI